MITFIRLIHREPLIAIVAALCTVMVALLSYVGTRSVALAELEGKISHVEEIGSSVLFIRDAVVRVEEQVKYNTKLIEKVEKNYED